MTAAAAWLEYAAVATAAAGDALCGLSAADVGVDAAAVGDCFFDLAAAATGGSAPI